MSLIDSLASSLQSTAMSGEVRYCMSVNLYDVEIKSYVLWYRLYGKVYYVLVNIGIGTLPCNFQNTHIFRSHD